MFEKVNPRLLRSEMIRRCDFPNCRAACCLHGVWVDTREAEDILANAYLIIPHMPGSRQDPGSWFDERREEDPHSLIGTVIQTVVVDAQDHHGGKACGFLRADHKCALQVAGETNGLGAWRLKPFYCILHPLDLDDEGRITLDEISLLMNEPASCLRPALEPTPLLQVFESELRYFLGDKGYLKLTNWETNTKESGSSE